MSVLPQSVFLEFLSNGVENEVENYAILLLLVLKTYIYEKQKSGMGFKRQDGLGFLV